MHQGRKVPAKTGRRETRWKVKTIQFPCFASKSASFCPRPSRSQPAWSHQARGPRGRFSRVAGRTEPKLRPEIKVLKRRESPAVPRGDDPKSREHAPGPSWKRLGLRHRSPRSIRCAQTGQGCAIPGSERGPRTILERCSLGRSEFAVSRQASTLRCREASPRGRPSQDSLRRRRAVGVPSRTLGSDA